METEVHSSRGLMFQLGQKDETEKCRNTEDIVTLFLLVLTCSVNSKKLKTVPTEFQPNN